ncbi:MAG TPA: hypothetical protein VK985_09465 [Rariglobus sp.]|nr:hypothetical protein [Rariglobus sp.]
MRIEILETDHCFTIEVHAETMAEAATLTRIGMNTTKNEARLTTYVDREGSFSSFVALKKGKRAAAEVPHR